MGRLKLSVVGESSYMDRLAECIRKNAPEYLEVSACSMEAEVPEFFARYTPDILLYENEEAVPEQLPEHTVKIRLADTDCMTQEAGSVIFRYQPGAEILRQVFQIYEKMSRENLVCWCKAADMEMTAFYAPGGLELQLPFSMVYAALCSERKKTLYLNLAEFSGMNFFLGDEEGENFSDLIYGIRQRKERFPFCLQGVLHHAEAFDYVLPPACPQDLYEIQDEDMTLLLSLLREKTEYEMIVWNFGTWNRGTIPIMEHCGRVFCLVKDSTFAKYRKEEFEQFLEKEPEQKLKQNVRFVVPQTGMGGFAAGADVSVQLKDSPLAGQVRELMQEEPQNSSGICILH